MAASPESVSTNASSGAQSLAPALLDWVIESANRAATLVLEMQRVGLRKVEGKSNEIDLVTEADGASEHFLREALGQLLPEAGFWGEESNQRPDSEHFWLVDPIDGTVNFAHGLPYHAINIALVRRTSAGIYQTELAVTAQMPWRRIYWAQAGQGAFMLDPLLGKRRLQVSTAATLRASLLATGFPYHTGEEADDNALEFAWFSPRSLGLRILGAGALDIAQVAAGVLAGFWEGWLNPWDCAAGALMVREAGGRVTDFAGNEWHIGSRGFVASNGLIHDAMIEGIVAARKGVIKSML